MEGRTYRYFQGEPLFAFGYGLSYTTFELDNLCLEPDRVAVGDEITLHVDVTNSGARTGDEVMQVYIRHPEATVPRPIKELKGFKRISLQPGERKMVTFVLHTHQLGYYDEAMRYAVHPGTVEVLVGNSSQHLPLSGSFVITGSQTEVDKVYLSQAILE
jgi:beta-glucosidase